MKKNKKFENSEVIKSLKKILIILKGFLMKYL